MNLSGFEVSTETLWLLGIAGGLAGLLLRHWLGESKDRAGRRASESAKFRSTIHEATAIIPNVNDHWGSEIESTLRTTLQKTKTAVAEFRPFVVWYRRHRFDRAWNIYRQHCEEMIPKQLSAAEILYGTGPQGAKDAKQVFCRNVEVLLPFAKQT